MESLVKLEIKKNARYWYQNNVITVYVSLMILCPSQFKCDRYMSTYQRQQHTKVAGIKVATPDSQLTVSPGRILAASAVRPGNKRNKILTYAT